ncbi:MAG: hypothetical protein R2705_03190 [Ilumatobacteraceae bacterium]
MNEYSERLLQVSAEVTPRWIETVVRARLGAAEIPVDPDLAERISAAARLTGERVADRLGAFLALDVDDQRSNPLAVFRAAVGPATDLLRSAGVPPVVRDDFELRAFPDDLYGLAPATWSDVDESLHEPGLIWGAWKAKTVLDRRRAEGRR